MRSWKCPFVIGLAVASLPNLCFGQGEGSGNSTGSTESRASPVGKSKLTREAIRQAVEKARDKNPGELMALADSIGREKDIRTRSDLLPDFEALLADEQPEAHYLGARGLFALKDPHSVRVLSEFLKSKAEGLRACNKPQLAPRYELPLLIWDVYASIFAVTALGEIGDRSVIPLLESLQGIRVIQLEWGGGTVEEALVQLGSFKSLTRLKTGDDRSKIEQAAHAIGDIKDANAAPELMAAVQDQSVAEEIRGASLSALGSIRAPQVPGFLVKILDDPNMPTQMRRTAAIAAGRTGDSSVEVPLKRYAEDRSSGIRADASMGLVILRPETYLGRWFQAVMDVRENTEFRTALAGKEFLIPRELLRSEKKRLTECLGATREDGRPLDEVRVQFWVIINGLFREEPEITLTSRSKEVTGSIRHAIWVRIWTTSSRLGTADADKQVDEVLEKLIRVQ